MFSTAKQTPLNSSLDKLRTCLAFNKLDSTDIKKRHTTPYKINC